MEDLDTKQQRELEHPIRRRIWDLYKEDKDRPLSARDLLDQMADMKERPSLSQVRYHLGQLQLLNLVPEPPGEE